MFISAKLAHETMKLCSIRSEKRKTKAGEARKNKTKNFYFDFHTHATHHTNVIDMKTPFQLHLLTKKRDVKNEI